MSPELRVRIGTITALALLLFAFVSIIWTPYPIDSLSIGEAMQGPSGAHLLGTDNLGRDVLSMLMRGLLTSFVVAGVGAALAAIIGVPLGYVAARWDAVPGEVLVTKTGELYAIPALVVSALVAGAFGPGTTVPMLAIGVFAAPAFVRATHRAMQVIGSFGYVEAAELAGLGHVEVLRRHIGPVLGPALLVLVVEQVGVGILAEAAIAFVGLGTQAPGTSLGLMLRNGQAYLAGDPGLVIVPGLLITIAALALNATAGVLRDTVDPALRRVGGVYAA